MLHEKSSSRKGGRVAVVDTATATGGGRSGMVLARACIDREISSWLGVQDSLDASWISVRRGLVEWLVDNVFAIDDTEDLFSR